MKKHEYLTNLEPVSHYPITIIIMTNKDLNLRYFENSIHRIFNINSNEPPTFAMFLNAVLNLLSALQLIPFRVERLDDLEYQSSSSASISKPSKLYTIVPNGLLSRTICGFFHFGTLVIGFWQLYSLATDEDELSVTGTTAIALRAVSDTADLITSFITIRLLWFRQNVILDAVNALASFSAQSTHVEPRQKRVISLAVASVSFNFIMGFLSVYQKTIGRTLVDSLTENLDALLKLFEYYDFLECRQYFQGFLYFWMYFAYRANMVFELNILGALVYAMYEIQNKFVEYLKCVRSIDQVKSFF